MTKEELAKRCEEVRERRISSALRAGASIGWEVAARVLRDALAKGENLEQLASIFEVMAARCMGAADALEEESRRAISALTAEAP